MGLKCSKYLEPDDTSIDNSRQNKPKSPNKSRPNNNQIENKKDAVLIGLNYPGTRESLNGCINDALRMEKTLAGFGYNYFALNRVSFYLLMFST